MSAARQKVKVVLCTLLAGPWLALYAMLLLLRPAKANRTFESFSQGFSLLPGTLGDWLRYGFCRRALEAVGQSVRISFGVEFSDREATMGDRMYLGARAHLGVVRSARTFW